MGPYGCPADACVVVKARRNTLAQKIIANQIVANPLASRRLPTLKNDAFSQSIRDALALRGLEQIGRVGGDDNCLCLKAEQAKPQKCALLARHSAFEPARRNGFERNALHIPDFLFEAAKTSVAAGARRR